MATFNGQLIVPMPTFPAAPRSIEWQANDIVGVNTNPFTGQQQLQQWNASYLEASVTMQNMSNAQAIAWFTWLLAMEGTANVFQMGDPLNSKPQNPAAVSPVASGGGQTGYQIVTTGGSNITVGDWIQMGFRLYRLTTITGGTLGIWPQIRESPSNGQGLSLYNRVGIWRLKSNTRKISVRETKMYGISFDIREAI